MYEKVKVYLTLKQTQIEFQSPFSKIEKAVPRTIYEGPQQHVFYNYIL